MHQTLLALIGGSLAVAAANAGELRVACVQMTVSREIEANTAAIIGHIETQAAAGARVVVFPEASLSGYTPQTPAATAEQVHAALGRVSAACARARVYAIVGTMRPGDGRCLNSAVVIGPDGREIYSYDKLFPVEGYVQAGERLGFFEIDGVPASLFVCHDERYPELMRTAVLAGARVAFYISFESATQSGKSFNYRCQLIGRAVENRCWLVACNAPAKNPCEPSHGHSCIIDPRGRVVAEAQAEPLVISAVVDPDTTDLAWAARSLRHAAYRDFWAEALRILKAGRTATSRPSLGAKPIRTDQGPPAKLRVTCAAAVKDAVEAAAIIEKLGDEVPHLIVFPEGTLANPETSAQDERVLAKACRKAGAWCIAGAVFHKGGHLHNGAVVISPDEKVVSRCSQIQPDRAEFSGGGAPGLVDVCGTRAAVLIGGDIHFPEAARIAVLGGARLLIYLSKSPAGETPDAALGQIVCRSVESQVFTAWCGPDANGKPSGQIVDPAGRVMGQDGAGLHSARIDTAKASDAYPRRALASPVVGPMWQKGLEMLAERQPGSSVAITEVKTTMLPTSLPAPTGTLRVATVQMLPATGDVPANLERAERLVRAAATEHRAGLIILPECTTTGYTNPGDGRMSLEATRALAEPIPGPATARFAALARELGAVIVLGLHESRAGRYYNSAAVLTPQEGLAGSYSKVHINRYEGAMGWTNGERFRVWPCSVGQARFNLGVMICFDREVPEAARCLTVLGADVVAVPQATGCTALFPIHRDQLRVRAYENEVYLAMANWAGPNFRGHSMIVNNAGEALRVGGESEEILVADLDLDALAKAREGGIYGRHHRRPATYGPLLEGAEDVE